uniref:Uncharacterized protein n=1 Tax=Helianthus annuus TaxID=4232 RepID=A0A251RU34_HELAN
MLERQSWLVDSNQFASKIKSASGACDPENIIWKSNPTKACPNCHHIVDNSDVNFSMLIKPGWGCPEGLNLTRWIKKLSGIYLLKAVHEVSSLTLLSMSLFQQSMKMTESVTLILKSCQVSNKMEVYLTFFTEQSKRIILELGNAIRYTVMISGTFAGTKRAEQTPLDGVQ